MADIHNTQSNVDQFDDRKRNHAAGEINIDSSRVGVYDRPRNNIDSRNSAVRTILLFVALVLFVYILFRWLT